MSIIRSTTPKDAVVNDIINREWEMFQKTQNMGGRAACQDQYDTFYANRYSQHCVLIGRNLITEKYGYMMEFTDPAYYNANLRDRLPALTEAKAQLVAQIVSLQLVGYQKYAAAFPALARAGRPAEESNLDTSIRDYSIGEYKTYSEGTLELVLRDIKRMDNPVMEIQKTLVSFYGFDSLQAAEAAQK